MASPIPEKMRAVVLQKYCKPADYSIAEIPVPKITKDDEVLIKVYATSINPVDVKMANGLAKMLKSDK
jgi:NADPH:quinone reductase-like Zn-dependent oxidoreductase